MKKRYYALFEKVNGKWERLSAAAYYKETAVFIWQNALLEGFFNGKQRELRPVKEEKRLMA